MICLVPLFAVSCEENEGVISTKTILDPTEAKDYLLETGLEFSRQIDAQDHRSICQLISYLEEKYEDYDTDAFDDYFDRLSQEFNFDESDEYYYSPVRILEPLAGCLGVASRGSITKAGTGMITHNIAFPKLYGKFTANDSKSNFKYDQSVDDRLEIVMYDKNSNPVVIKMTGSKKTTRLTCRYQDSYSEYEDGKFVDSDESDDYFVVDVPQTITLTVTQNGKELICATVTSNLNVDADIEYETVTDWTYHYGWWDEEREHSLDMSIDYSNVNMTTTVEVDGYETKTTVSLSQKALDIENSLTINGTFMYSLSATVRGDLSNLDETAMEIFEDESDDLISDYIDERGLKASLEANVMNKVKVNMSVPDAAAFYDSMDDLEDALFESKSSVEKALKKANGKFESALYLDNSTEMTAYLELDYFKNEDYHPYYDEKEWYIEPILIFCKDQSAYRFEEYFTEKSFQKLIDAYEEIEEDFEDLADRYLDDLF